MINDIRQRIEELRIQLDLSMESGEDYEAVYQISIELDDLINEYIEYEEKMLTPVTI